MADLANFLGYTRGVISGIENEGQPIPLCREVTLKWFFSQVFRGYSSDKIKQLNALWDGFKRFNDRYGGETWIKPFDHYINVKHLLNEDLALFNDGRSCKFFNEKLKEYEHSKMSIWEILVELTDWNSGKYRVNLTLQQDVFSKYDNNRFMYTSFEEVEDLYEAKKDYPMYRFLHAISDTVNYEITVYDLFAVLPVFLKVPADEFVKAIQLREIDYRRMWNRKYQLNDTKVYLKIIGEIILDYLENHFGEFTDNVKKQIKLFNDNSEKVQEKLIYPYNVDFLKINPERPLSQGKIIQILVNTISLDWEKSCIWEKNYKLNTK